MFHGSFQDVKEVLTVFHGSFKVDSRKFQGCFNGVLCGF